VLAREGSCCLVQDQDDTCWYRGEIVELEDSKEDPRATLFLLDIGKMVQSSMSKLKPLPKELESLKGLVSKVNLKGVKSVGMKYSNEDVEKAMHILDVGNDTTQFKAKVVKVDSKGERFVVMKNLEGNDVLSVMMEAGIIEPEKLSKKEMEMVTKGYKAGTLPQGVQKVLILKAVSPMELYICSQERFVDLEMSMTMLEKEAVKADPVKEPVPGDAVLACDDSVWYRAKVTKVIHDDMVQVELVDLASSSSLHLSQLRKPTVEAMKDQVMAVSCCLESWVKEDMEVAKEKWEFKIPNMVEFFEEIQVDVVGEADGHNIVRMQELEKKLKSGSKSVAELLKERARAL